MDITKRGSLFQEHLSNAYAPWRAKAVMRLFDNPLLRKDSAYLGEIEINWSDLDKSMD